ncbi:hypothetical protein BSL82_05630 [Tardibacter chloracetimidivorans]|uniref:Methyltransferase domain-containing protein n=1 Tax=Tardibacter chloracetimidivorans TaxID=1921510 RepID=A0A1L3ZT92_9SPHN|nr:class I SAM-dependent methyltransferase [Tardibacter chloracetimidivorans]API58853.1 hypothetical protein BSL82_05630 [Tardibacter chloracetimidivorans]
MSTMLRAIRATTLPVAVTVNGWVRALSRLTHKAQFLMQWGVHPNPEWFDTYLAQHYEWPAKRTSWLWDRGVYSVLGMPAGANVLEICCGGGFFTRNFYSGRAAHVTACDFDPTAIRHANRFNRAPNVRYELCDIRERLPAGQYDHIIWDAAIEHFTEDEMAAIMGRIKAAMNPGAILSGYTIKERDDGGEQHHEHEYEFKSLEDMTRVFKPYFKNVLAFETAYPERHNLYFMASDGVLPFDKDWPNALRVAA